MPDCSKPRIPASVLQDGPSVQMILARRNGEGLCEEGDGILDDPLMIRRGASIVREQAVKIGAAKTLLSRPHQPPIAEHTPGTPGTGHLCFERSFEHIFEGLAFGQLA